MREPCRQISRRRWRLGLGSLTVVAVFAVFGGAAATGARADGVLDQQHAVEQIAAQLDNIANQIGQLDEDYGAAQDKKDALDAEIGDMQAQVDAQQAQLDALNSTLTQIVVDKYTSGSTTELSPLFADATSYSDAQQRDALNSLSLDSGAGDVDQMEALAAGLGRDKAALEHKQQQAAALVASLADKQAKATRLESAYQEQYTAAKAKYGELVQQEQDRRAAAAVAKADDIAKQQATAAAAAAAAAKDAADTQASAQAKAKADADAQTTPSSANGTPKPSTSTAPARGGGAPAAGTTGTGSGGGAAGNGATGNTTPVTKPASNTSKSTPTTSPATSGTPTPTSTPAKTTTGTASGGKANDPKSDPSAGGAGGTANDPPPPSSRASVAVAAALSQLGVPYRFAAESPGVAFDCSGLTKWAWGRAGVSLPHQSAQQYGVTRHISQADIQPGDLVFYHTPIGHVAIYIGNGQIVHAPRTGDVVKIRPVNWANVVGISRPG